MLITREVRRWTVLRVSLGVSDCPIWGWRDLVVLVLWKFAVERFIGIPSDVFLRHVVPPGSTAVLRV